MAEHDDTLRERVLDAVRAHPLRAAIRDVQIEPAADDDGEAFLRVKLLVQLPKEDVDEQLQTLLEQIEESVAAIDDRYASVRFLDAA